MMRAGTPAVRAAWQRLNTRFFIAAALLAGVVATFPGMAALAADTDNDLIPDTADNCILVANTSQLDADQDGNGNACDGDLDNSGMVTEYDFMLMKFVVGLPSGFSRLAAAADMDGNGRVSSFDAVLLREMIGAPPGPSGLVSAGGTNMSGSALVSWLRPTRRTDGSVLTNLAGYQIRFGTHPWMLDRTIWLDDPGLTSYLVEGLGPGNWFFALVAVDSDGLISPTIS